jgi:hypothetical protein
MEALLEEELSISIELGEQFVMMDLHIKMH